MKLENDIKMPHPLLTSSLTSHERLSKGWLKEQKLMLSTIISAMFGLLGVLIGVFSTHFLHYKNHKSEEIKIINESIHYLLEVFFLINRLSAEKMTNVYFEYYFQRIRKLIPTLDGKIIENAKAQYTPMIKQSLVPAMQKHSFECLKRLGVKYEEMIANLAAFLPVTAYYLRGKNNLEDLLKTVSKYFEDIKVAEEKNAPFVNKVINQMQPTLIADLINEYGDDLKLELLVLLRKTTWHNRWAGKKAIQSIELIELNENEKQKIDSMVVNVVNQVVQSMEKIQQKGKKCLEE